MNRVYKQKRKRYYFIITAIFILSFLSYEIHLYEYYSLTQMILSVLLIGLMGTYFLCEKASVAKFYLMVKKNNSIVLLFIWMIFVTILGNFIFGLNSPLSALYVVIMLCCLFPSFFILPSILNENKKLFNYFVNLITWLGCALAFFAIIIYHFPDMLPYGLEGNRARSIYFDPNYTGTVLGITTMLNLNSRKKKRSIFVCLLCGYAIFLTGSRGTVLSIVAAVVIYCLLFSKMHIFKRIIAVLLLSGIALVCIDYLKNIGFFREYQGLNGRDQMLLTAIRALKDSPIIGYGYQSIATYLVDIKKFENVSTHNTFADYAFSYGYIALLIYIGFIAKNFLKGVRNNNEAFLILVIIFMIINMNSIVYNLGGVGIGALLFTVFLGLAATRKKEHRE